MHKSIEKVQVSGALKKEDVLFFTLRSGPKGLLSSTEMHGVFKESELNF